MLHLPLAGRFPLGQMKNAPPQTIGPAQTAVGSINSSSKGWSCFQAMSHLKTSSKILLTIKGRSTPLPTTAMMIPASDCQGFWNPHRLQVGYRRVWVRVQIPVPATYKMSLRTSKTDENWWRYGQNGRKHHLAQISVISWSFWLIFGGKTRGFAGRVSMGTGTGYP